ncbi:MAG TPA: type II secretion system protein N [Casimicrobiaceae bacterium]|nr:type II secretion system protein N [Casimicrobiaceae bacterium]
MRILVALLALIGLAAIAIVAAPASLLAPWIASQTQGSLRLLDAGGTVWRGRGTLQSAQSTAGVPIAWRVRSVPLLQGDWRVELTPQTPDMPHGTVQVSGDQVTLSGIKAQLPASLFQSDRSPAGAIALGGNVVLDVPRFQWSGRTLSGTGDARWERARLALGTLGLDLGTVSVHLVPAGAGVSGALRNEGGDLQLSGTLNGSPDGTLVIEGRLRPAATLPQWAVLALAAFGRPDAQGAIPFTWRVKL